MSNELTFEGTSHNLADLSQIVEELNDNKNYLKYISNHVSGWQHVDVGNMRLYKTFRALSNTDILVGIIKFDHTDPDSKVTVTIKVI